MRLPVHANALMLAVVTLAAACSGTPAVTNPTPPASPPAQPPPAFALTGTVHESVPTETTLIAGARVDAIGGEFNGQTVTTDASGSFSLPIATRGGFELAVSKSGYDSLRVSVPELQANTTLEIALAPQLTILTEVFEGDLNPVCATGAVTAERSLNFVAHHAGPLTFLEGIMPLTGFDASILSIFEDEVRIWYSSVPYRCSQCGRPLPLAAGKRYRMTVALDNCVSYKRLSGQYRIVFTHPN